MQTDFPQSELLLTITAGIVLMLLLALALVLFYYFSQQKFQAQQLLTQQQEFSHQRQLLFHSIQVQEQERERVARELHDAIGSKLNVLNLGLHQLKKSGDEDVIREMFTMVDATLSASRRIAYDLLPPTLLNFGLATALEELCHQAQQTSSLHIQFKHTPSSLKSYEDSTSSLHYFRVIQELISNTLKYAQATEVHIKLTQSPQVTSISYRDNGRGFDPTLPVYQRGMGINNIKVRMQMIDATFTLDSEPGKGIYFQAQKTNL